MKKILSIAAVAAMMLFAGKANAQITLHAGWQNATVKLEGMGSSWSHDYSGFYAGATYDYDLGMASIFVTPGAELSYCTYSEEGESADQIDLRIRLWGRWNKNLTEDIVFGVFAGPSINIGIGGELYSDADDISRFDLGLTFGAQIRYNKIGIEGGYNLGLLNRYSGEYDATIKFSTLFFGLNYIL